MLVLQRFLRSENLTVMLKVTNDSFEYGTASYEKQATGSTLPKTVIKYFVSDPNYSGFSKTPTERFGVGLERTVPTEASLVLYVVSILASYLLCYFVIH
ncbi:MAG: hypothetical protein ACJA2E_002303 [Arenicella sp.]|jgi:hypothetical protein